MSVRWLFLLLMSLVHQWVAAQSFGYQFAGKKSSIVLPFESRNNLIVLKVSINGSKPYNFILDSGSRNTFLLRPDLMDSLSLQPSGQIFVMGAGLKDTVTADIIRGARLESGDLMGKFQSILVLSKELPEISDMLGLEVHGILGADLFNRYAIRVNYKKRKLILMEPDVLKSQVGFTEVPVEVSNNKGYINTLIYNEWLQPKTAKMMIDCGASLAMMFNFSEEDSNAYPLFSEYIPSEIGIGLAGVIPGYIGRLKNAQIAGYPMNDVIISAVPTTRSDDYFLNERDGLIGSEVLSRFHIWYNFPLGKMYIKPARGFDRPFYYDRSGIIWMTQRFEDGSAVVKQVVLQSPAYDAGLMAGDVVTNINGASISSMSNADLTAILRFGKKKKITLDILRQGKEMNIRFKLKEYF